MEKMRFRVIFASEAEADFLKLPKSIQELVRRAIKDRLETAPLSYGKPLSYTWRGYRSLRVSNYRVIYRVDQEKITVLVVKVDIRRDVYD